MVFSIFIRLCKPLSNSRTLSSPPKKKPCTPLTVTVLNSLPHSPTTINLLSVFMDLPVLAVFSSFLPSSHQLTPPFPLILTATI